ncbi:hypothetical protein [Cellulosilyticum sp. I15G10I2]|uniref:hypothetical protein n=1 Tax=Cellulosilyticum sp. I15G10I2 TaxID=1892843 RepID=UPI00085CC73E|nr:hypothetical protein [Cellulosilyticum sp. I15G10I2]
MNQRDKEEQRKIDEYKKNPLINFSDSINRSMTGDLGALTKGGCLHKIIITGIITALLFFLSRCSN